MTEDTIKWIIGMVVTTTLAWSSWVTSAVWEDRARLARIETKIDIIIDKALGSTASK
jgi:hypothetical protein